MNKRCEWMHITFQAEALALREYPSTLERAIEMQVGRDVWADVATAMAYADASESARIAAATRVRDMMADRLVRRIGGQQAVQERAA